MISYAHTPVMMEEVLKHLDCFDEKVFIDATLGGGGHAEAILGKITPRGRLVGIDCDKDGILASQGRLENFRENLIVVQSNFRYIKKVWEKLNIPPVNGVLFDLGVSSFQLKEGSRGFSFSKTGKLDMRLSQEQETSASDLVNDLPYDELARIIFEYGEERFSRRIARAIIEERSKHRIETTEELAEIVRRALGGRGKIHPATRTFQALRIAVNEELKALEDGLFGALDILAVGGRVVVISYHSLEDRIVKNIFRNKAREDEFVLITKKPLVPSFQEVRENPSSRSAKMRVIERSENVSGRISYR